MITLHAVPKHPDGPRWRVVIDGETIGLDLITGWFSNHEEALSFIASWLDQPVKM